MPYKIKQSKKKKGEIGRPDVDFKIRNLRAIAPKGFKKTPRVKGNKAIYIKKGLKWDN